MKESCECCDEQPAHPPAKGLPILDGELKCPEPKTSRLIIRLCPVRLMRRLSFPGPLVFGGVKNMWVDFSVSISRSR